MASSCDQNPFALLIELAARLDGFFADAANEVGLTKPQAQVLMSLEEPRRMSDLAQANACDPSSSSTMVQRLEREGLVRRTVDPLDARARLVQLTPKGARARARLAALVADADQVIAQLSEEHRSALAKLFTTATFAR